MDLLEAKNTALSCLKISSKEIMSWFRTNMTVESKSDQSPVTIADRKAEEILRKKISKAYPGHGIIGEEFGEEGSQSEWVWTIDPIDGTRSFIRGLPLFATLIGKLDTGYRMRSHTLSTPNKAHGFICCCLDAYGVRCNA